MVSVFLRVSDWSDARANGRAFVGPIRQMAAVTNNTHPENANNRHRQPSAASTAYSKLEQRLVTRELKNSAIFLNFLAPQAFLARLPSALATIPPKAQQKSCTLSVPPLIALECVSSVDRRAIGWETHPPTFRFLVHVSSEIPRNIQWTLFRFGTLSNDLINGKANNLFSQSPPNRLWANWLISNHQHKN